MAEVIGLISGLLTLATFAHKSVTKVQEAVQSFRTLPRQLRELLSELAELSTVLQDLSQAPGGDIEVDLSALKITLEQCSRSCEEFEKELRACSSRSGQGRASFRDWAKLTYRGGDGIEGFRQQLIRYKSTIIIALSFANLRTSTITVEAIQSYRELIETTTIDLEAHLADVKQKLDVLASRAVANPERDEATLKYIENERLSTKKGLQLCLQLCLQLSQQTDQIQLQYATEEGHTPSLLNPHRTLSEGRDRLTETIDRLQERLEFITREEIQKSDPRCLQTLGDQTAEQCQEICESANEQVTNQKLYTTSGILADGDSDHSVITTLADLFDDRKESVSYTGHISDETARKINVDDSNKSGEGSMNRSLKPLAVSDTTFSEVYDPFCSDAEGSTHPSSLSYNFRDRDQEPDNRSTMTFFKYEKSKLQEDVGDLKDDIQSISSIPDEIGSRAESESDMSMFHHAAITFLVNTLTSNHNLVALYKEVTQRTQQAKFIANHRRLLKQYFLKLREDGQEFSQKSAIEILRPRHLRTLISQEIWNLVVPRDREERKSIVSFIEQDKDQLVMLDRFLHENGPAPAPETINSTFDSFQSDSSDEDEFKETENILTNLEAAREFFVSGRPFQIYQESLRQFLKPTPVLARVLRHSNTSSLNRISTHHLTTSAYGNLEQQFGATYGSLKATSVEAVQRMTNMATDNTDFNIETDIKVHDGTKQLSQVQDSSSAAQLAPRSAARRGAVAIMARIYAKILTLLSNIGWREEDIAPGYHRVRWRNRRGKWLYDDYVEHEAGALQALEGYLNSSTYVSAAESSLENSSGSAIVIPSSSRMNQFQGNTSGSAGVADQNLRSSVIGRCSSSQQDPEKGKLTSNTLHVLCCMDQRKRAVVLHEELITNITDDRHLFQALHNSYRKHRGRFKHYWSLRAIQSIHFMKFAYGGRQYIDVRCHREICEQGKPCICLPPPDLVRPVGSEYECSPIPSKFSPPIGPRLMKDLFTHPEDIEPNSELVLRQLPKWACGNLPTRRVEIKETWGIYYEEDWDWTKIWWILGLGFFPPSLLFGIFWGILKKDIQGAFSIASWWMTGAAIVIGIVGTTT